MRLTQEYIQNLRDRKPILQVAQALGMELHRGRAICPWHPDKHPSLHFSAQRNTCHCFSCGKTADAVELVMKVLGIGFREAIEWLSGEHLPPSNSGQQGYSSSQREYRQYPPDMVWLSELVQYPYLNAEARRFLFEERKLDPKIIAWAGITSINTPMPYYRDGRPFFDAPSLLIPYRGVNGELLSVQSRYLGPQTEDGERKVSRFKFPPNARPGIYGLPMLRHLADHETLHIAEGVSDCLSMWSCKMKAIAIPSASMLTRQNRELLQQLAREKHTVLESWCDADPAGAKLEQQLREALPNLVTHALAPDCKDFSEYYVKQKG